MIPIVLILIISLIFLAGCEKSEVKNVHYTYQGKSAHWRGNLEIIGSATITKKDGKNYYKTPYEILLTLKYIGDSPQVKSSELIQYSYSIGSIGGSEMCDFNKIINHEHRMNQGVLDINPDEGASVTVKWGKHTETMQLTNK